MAEIETLTEADRAALVRERDEARAHAKFAEDEHGKADAECDVLHTKIARLTEALAEAESRAQVFKCEADAAEARVRELEQQVAEEVANYGRAIERARDAESELAQLRADHDEERAEHRATAEEFRHARAEVELLSDETTRRTRETVILAEDQRQLMSRLSAAAELLRWWMASNGSVTSPFDRTRAFLANQPSALVGAEAELAQLRERVAEHEQRRTFAIEALRDDDDPSEALALLEGRRSRGQ